MFNSYASATGFSRTSQKAVCAGLALSSSVSVAVPAVLANGSMPVVYTPVAFRQSPVPSASANGFNANAAHGHQAANWSWSTKGAGQLSGGTSAKLKTELTTVDANTTLQTANNGILNLGSTALNFLAGTLGNLQNLTIDVGGRQQVISLNTKLTGAEMVAAEQVLTTGTQSLKLSASGQATGGSVFLNNNLLTAIDNLLGGSISSLTVSHGVQLVDSLSNLNLTGSLTNYGSILTAGSVSGGTDKISAGSILNAPSAAIGSYTGANGTGSGNSGGSTGAGSSSGGNSSNRASALFAADPSLSASTAITNNGNISSSGNLTITAPTVNNSAASGSSALASITAAHNVNITAQTLNNAGQINAVTGNVNLQSSGALDLNGAGGTIQANNGNINLSTANADINAIGGNMLSQQVNFSAGTGNISTNLGEVTGTVNASGNAIHIGANTPNLQMGQIDASGDPLVSNNADITITSSSMFTASGQPLALVAGKDINSAGGGIIDTSSVTGNGGNLTLIAGALFTATTGNGIKITGASTTGGDIDLTGGNGGSGAVTQITTNSNAPGNKTGGSIEMVAFAGTTGGGQGAVILPTSALVPVNAAGSGTGAAGAITIIAGAAPATTAITTGTIVGKTVTIETATPILPSGGVTFANTGVQSGTISTTPASITAANASIGNVTGTLNITTNGTATVTNSTTALTLGTVNVGTTGTLLATNTGTGPNGNINVAGLITGNSITIGGTGTVDITKTVTGTGPSSQITIDGGAANTSSNAVEINAVVNANTINVGLSAGAVGNVVLTDAVGSKTTTLVNITAGSGATGGTISGAATITATTQITLGAASSIGTSAKPIETDTPILSINPLVQNTGGSFVDQKVNVSLGNSNSDNLVVKVTGNLDVTGTINAPAQNISSTGTFTVDGSITNAGTATGGQDSILLTSAKNFTLNPLGSITAAVDSQPVTIKVTGIGTINGTISVKTLDLTTSLALNIGSATPGTGILNDGTDNIAAKANITVDGQIIDTTLSMTTTTDLIINTFNAGSTIAVSGSGTNNITAKTITIANNAISTGNIIYVASATGDAITNNGTINGTTVTVNTTSSTGVIDNATAGSTIEATVQNTATDVPTLNLISRIIDNAGTIQAFGGTKEGNGLLKITSPSTLTISGQTGGFLTNFSSAVSLTADGNITIGNSTTNPFSNLTAANGLGSFSVTTPDIFTSPMSGITVATNAAGTVGGTISLTAGSLAFNGTGPSAALNLTSTGAGSSTIIPVLVDITGAKGLIVGSAAGDVTVAVSGFGPTNVVTLITKQALVLDTTPALFNINGSSLTLTGTKSVLVQGDLALSTAPGTDLTINSPSTTPFLIGGATTNGQDGITSGQGMTAYQLLINTPGSVVELQKGTAAPGAVLNGVNGVTIDAKGLTVNQFANIISAGVGSTGLTLTAATGTLNYTNLNTTGNPTNFTSLINLNDGSGTLTLGSGATGSTQTMLSVGSTATGGGTFNINAEAIAYGSGGILFNATDGTNGGAVNLTLTGTTAVKVGTGAGNISANVSSNSVSGNGIFDLTTSSSITATNLFNATTPSQSAIQFGATGSGKLILDADGSTSKLSLKGITGIDINTIALTSHSTTAFVMSGATGGNGILDGTSGTPAVITAGVLTVANSGQVATNGVNINSVANALQQLSITSGTSINFSLNQSIITGPNSAVSPGTGGIITLSTPSFILGGTGLSLAASGGTSTGGNISVTSTSTSALVTIGTGAGMIALDVSNTQGNIGGTVSVKSEGALTVDGSAINFGANTNVGSTLNLTSGFGGNLLLNNASSLTGLRFGTINLTSGGTKTFLLNGAIAGSNGIGTFTGLNSLTAGAINITAQGGTAIDTTGEMFLVNQLTLTTTGTISIASSQTIAASPDGIVGSGSATGNGGTININAGSISGSQMNLSAVGSNSANTVGGNINIVASTSAASPIVLGTFGATKGLSFDVSDDGGKATGTISVSNAGNDISVGATTAFSYGTAGGGSLTLSGNNILISSATSLNGLSSISIKSNSASTFEFGNAKTNGFQDSSPETLTATSITIGNSGGGLDTTGNASVSANAIILNTSGLLNFGANLSATPLSGNGGSIIITAGNVNVFAGLALSAAGTTGTGGSVMITLTGTKFSGTSGLIIGSSGLSVDVSNAAGTGGGKVNISDGTGFTADLSAVNLGGSFAAGKGANLALSAIGALLLSKVSTVSGIGLNDLTFVSSSTQAFQLGGATTNGISDAGLTLTAGNITITNNSGAITNGSLVGLSGTTSVTLTAQTNIGASGANNQVVVAGTPSLTLNAGGNAYISTTGTTSITNANVVNALQVTGLAGNLAVGGASPANFSAGSVNISYNNASAGNSNSLTLNSIATTNGDLTVSSNAENLVVAPGASLNTTNGNITLSNTDVTNASAIINIGAGSTIHGSGAASNLNQGNVYIVMGAAPPSFSPTLGTIPGATILSTGGAAVTFGALTSNPNGSIEVNGTSDVLSALGRNLAFNTTGAFGSGAITLGANVTITADPPPSAGPAQITAAAAPAAAITAALNSASSFSSSIPTASSGSANSTGSFGSLAAPGLSMGPGFSGLSNATNNSLFAAVTNSLPLPPSVNSLTITISTGSANSTVSGISTGVLDLNAQSAATQNIIGGSTGSTDGQNSQSTDDSTSTTTSSVAGATAARALTGGVSNTAQRRLDNGALLLSPQQYTTVDTPFGQVGLSAGSMALIISSANCVAIYNLYDQHKNAVSINHGGKSLTVPPGRTIVLSKASLNSFEQANPAPFVAYRRLSSNDLSAQTKMYLADFDMASMMHGLPGLKDLIASDSPRQRKIANNMIKTAAILSQITATAEPYARYLTPALTASALAAGR